MILKFLRYRFQDTENFSSQLLEYDVKKLEGLLFETNYYEIDDMSKRVQQELRCI